MYLLALLNAPINYNILRKQLKNEHEKDFLISRSSLKDYVRIPKITAKNKKLKDKIIALTESLLALENVVLRDIVDFGKLNVQRFDNIKVIGSELVLSNGKEFRCKIQTGQSMLVQHVVESFTAKEEENEQTFSLQELKTLPAIDFDMQAKIKKQVDDLVFALYFDVPPEKAEQHEFYRLIYSSP